MQVLELNFPKTGDEITAEAETDGTVTLQAPFTHSGWKLIDAAECGQGVVLIPSDGGSFIGEITDIEPERHLITIELR